MEKLPPNLKSVKCIANEYTFWEQLEIILEKLDEKEGIDINERKKSKHPKNTLTIGKEYKVIKIDNKGCIVIKNDFGIVQRRSRKYFELPVKEPKKVQKLSIKKKIVKKLVRFLNGL